MAWFCAACGSPNAPTQPACGVCRAPAPQISANAAQASYQAAQQPWGAQPQAPMGAAGYPGPAGHPHPGPAGHPHPGGPPRGAAPQQAWGAQPPMGGAPFPGGPQPPMGGAPFPGGPAPGAQPGQPWGAQQQPYGVATPGMYGAPKKEDNSKLFIGCGIAGCLGLVVVVVLVVAFTVLSSGSSSSGSDDGGSSGPSQPSGGLADNVPRQVGEWRVSSAKRFPVQGAVDALDVRYASGGLEIQHVLAVFSDTDTASRALIGATEKIAADVPVRGEVVKITNPQGQEIGIGSHFQHNPEVLAYRIGKLMAIVQGPRGNVLPFFKALP